VEQYEQAAGELRRNREGQRLLALFRVLCRTAETETLPRSRHQRAHPELT
jgi:hypothetical protein